MRLMAEPVSLALWFDPHATHDKLPMSKNFSTPQSDTAWYGMRNCWQRAVSLAKMSNIVVTVSPRLLASNVSVPVAMVNNRLPVSHNPFPRGDAPGAPPLYIHARPRLHSIKSMKLTPSNHLVISSITHRSCLFFHWISLKQVSWRINHIPQ